MAYELKQSPEKVYLHVLAGATNSLVGLKFPNCEIIEMSLSEYEELVCSIYGGEMDVLLMETLMKHQILFKEDHNVIILEVCEYTESLTLYEEHILEALKLYKAEDIYSCFFITYRYKDNVLSRGGMIRNIRYEHGIDYLPARYSLSHDEKKSLPEWYKKYEDFSKLQYNSSFRNILRTYYTSYLVGIPELEYIMLFSILEMVFGGHFEINYQISRGTALLLSNNAREMKDIIKKIKKLYNDRSKYVHEGQSVSRESLYELREIVRKVIIKLIELNYHLADKKMSDLKDEICLGGYGSFNETEENPNV